MFHVSLLALKRFHINITSVYSQRLERRIQCDVDGYGTRLTISFAEGVCATLSESEKEQESCLRWELGEEATSRKGGMDGEVLSSLNRPEPPRCCLTECSITGYAFVWFPIVIVSDKSERLTDSRQDTSCQYRC